MDSATPSSQLAGDPGAGVAAEQRAAHAARCVPPPASISEDSEAPCSISYTPGWATAPDSVTSADPGWVGVPSWRNQSRAVAGDQREMRERLDVVDERRPPLEALLEGIGV